MGIILNIIITAATVFATAFGIVNYVPMDWLGFDNKPNENFLGATVTELNSTDQLSDFPTLYNNNLNALNDNKMEMSTTSVDSIATLSNLATVGTITSGTWNADTVAVAYGGTGSTTLSSNQILLGNGTGNIKTVDGWGTAGQILTSNGGTAAPTWQVDTTDQTADYTWTGEHTFDDITDFNATSTMATTTLDRLGVGTTTPNYDFSVNGDVFFNSGLGIGAATTSDGNLLVTNYLQIDGEASTTNMTVSNVCNNCVSEYERISAATTCTYTNYGTCTATANCSAGKKVLGGGHKFTINDASFTDLYAYAISDTAFEASVTCPAGICADITVTAYAICATD
jgi:hypothetical protein